ncbi:hypothetical protein P6B95_01060 [Streptomyces atratus]|uniref:hypothetical protein n=1 Tax=Streptomyces atratus TaxID=1893 RepID=UPI001670EFC9|nr:hypothetical protein [Streptomyces atratus]WPW26193.1 hypothetical protein P6B95_01060 [Streptomyces atratus]GGT57249.1 hypothetical protein GCM10010207_66340 [Streptomyces atratus]
MPSGSRRQRLGGAVIEGGNAGLGFTTFATAAVLGAAAICLVPLALRARRGAATQQTSALAGATD